MLQEENPGSATGVEAGPHGASNPEAQQTGTAATGVGGGGGRGAGAGGERRVAGLKLKTFIGVMLSILAVFILIAVVVVVVLYFMHPNKTDDDGDNDDDAKSKGRSFSGGAIDLSRQVYQTWALNAHNRARSVHHAPPVKLNTQITKKAFKCAQYYLRIRKTDHSCPHKMMDGKDCEDECGPYGENFYLTLIKGEETELDVMKQAMAAWYQEYQNYDFSKGTPIKRGKKIRHFTQMVWTEVAEIGVAIMIQGTTAIAEVLYNPEGNIPDEYTIYVKPRS